MMYLQERKLHLVSLGYYTLYILSNLVIRPLGQRQKGIIARSILLRPGGPLASELAKNAVVLKINDWVFCHGGLLPHHGNYGT